MIYSLSLGIYVWMPNSLLAVLEEPHGNDTNLTVKCHKIIAANFNQIRPFKIIAVKITKSSALPFSIDSSQVRRSQNRIK